MSVPTRAVDLLALIRQSGVLDEAILRDYLSDHRVDDLRPGVLAGDLIQAGLLTQFQAEQLLRGKWRGFSLGKYRILDRLGQGGMGQVFLALHSIMEHRVALKVVPPSQLEQPGVLERFLREARATARLDHPNLVRAFDVDQENGVYFLVLEFIEGVNLQTLVQNRGPLTIPRAVQCTHQAAMGLQYAHERGLIHRDIKPANLVMDRVGQVKLLDLGLARFFDSDDDGLTRKFDRASVLGTADYLAPEQALNSHEVDIRADIYSLGATLYYLLSGRTPYQGPSMRAKLMAAQAGDPPRLEEIAPRVPAELAQVVRHMMARDRNQRLANPLEVAQALQPWVVPLPPPADSDFPTPSRGPGGSSTRVQTFSSSSFVLGLPAPLSPDATPPPSAPLTTAPREAEPEPTRRPRRNARRPSALLAIGVAFTVLAALAALAIWLLPLARSPVH